MVSPPLRQLDILEAVARCGSFSRASADLHLTQPAVSMQIKQLESALGTPLFEHIGKRIQLTAAGQETLQASPHVSRETLLQHLAENSIDLALMGQPPEGHDLTAQPFMDNPLVVIAAPTHPLARQRHLPLARLAEAPHARRAPGS